MLNPPLISIIMSVYKEKPKWLRESVESILRQSYKNIEFIVVVDNPQAIDLIEILKEYQSSDKRLKLLINSKNRGLVFSLNRALKEINGEYIARMDADDIAHIDRLQKQLNYLKENNLDLIGSNINLFNKDGIFFTTNKLITHKYIKKLLYYGTIDIVHPTFFGTRELFNSLKGYANSLHTEDKEFLARAICSGYKVGNIKDVLLDCRYSSSSITKSNAVYVYKVGSYITKIFQICVRGAKYNYSQDIVDNLSVSKKEVEDYRLKQLQISKARESLNSKKYLDFLINITKATYHSKSTLGSIKVNLIYRVLKFLESIEFRGKV